MSRTPRVLLIDDDAFTCEVIGHMLRELDVAEVILASNGHEGLQVLSQLPTPPDLLLCDLLMPETDGIQLLQHLADQHYKGAVVILSGAMSAQLNLARRLAEVRGLNILGSIQKPVHREVLANLLKQVEMA